MFWHGTSRCPATLLLLNATVAFHNGKNKTESSKSPILMPDSKSEHPLSNDWQKAHGAPRFFNFFTKRPHQNDYAMYTCVLICVKLG